MNDLISRKDIEGALGISVGVQEVWHSTNRYGWRDMAIKVGRSVRYRREDIEHWLESRSVKNIEQKEGKE